MGTSETLTWYDELREKYRPKYLSFLFVAESPPDPDGGEKRFFYSATLSQHDNLFRAVAEAIYGPLAVYKYKKTDILKDLQVNGFWLIDAVDFPVNLMSASGKRKAIEANVPKLVKYIADTLKPSEGIIICKPNVYDAAALELRKASVQILHEGALPFPLYAGRAWFVSGLQEAVGQEKLQAIRETFAAKARSSEPISR